MWRARRRARCAPSRQALSNPTLPPCFDPLACAARVGLPPQVAQYACTFFERYHEIKEAEKLMRRIEAGEAKLARRNELDACLARKVQMCDAPWIRLKVDYKALGASEKPYSHFTVENDRLLICLALQVGYGRWEELTKEVRKSWVCKFDFYMKTRVPAEFGKRVEYLAKLIEKELQDLDAAKKEEEKKAKKAARQSGGGGGAGSKRPGDDDGGGGGGKRRKE